MEQLILPDGKCIASGVWGEPAMVSVRWTQNRNEDGDLTLGYVACATLEIELFSVKKPSIPPETRLIYQEDGVTRGIFYCKSLARKSQNRWTLRAQDGMGKFSRELTGFWKNREDDTALSLLLGLCQHCGVATQITQLPGGGTPVPKLAGYSAKQILHFLGQVAGQYFYMDAAEKLCFGWYDELQAIDDYSHLACAEFITRKIERVWLRQTPNDVGWAYPEDEEERNTLILQGNPIFAADARITAQRLLEGLSYFTHTPFTCTLLPGDEVRPGCLVAFTDQDGVSRLGAVMQWEKKNGTLTVRGTGSYSLDSLDAIRRTTLEQLEGQVLEISRTAQGISAAHRDLLGNVGAMQLNLEGIRTQVTQVTQLASQTTQLQQTAQGLELQVSQLAGVLDGKTDREEFTQVTEHFRFDADGMTIQNSATGMGIRVSEEQVLFLGGEDPTTAIYPDAMETTRLSVAQRLDVGDFSFLPRTNGNLSFRYTKLAPEEPESN